MLQPVLAQEVICDDDEVLTPIAGKIFNNGVQPGTTLGTVHMKVDRKKMKCGILGQGAAINGSINFIHTIVCDDHEIFPLTGDTIHSQLTLNTTGSINDESCPDGFPEGSTFGTFTEISSPIPGTGRGIFTGLEPGEINIEGSINCLFAIDMSFSGDICLKNQQ